MVGIGINYTLSLFYGNAHVCERNVFLLWITIDPSTFKNYSLKHFEDYVLRSEEFYQMSFAPDNKGCSFREPCK